MLNKIAKIFLIIGMFLLPQYIFAQGTITGKVTYNGPKPRLKKIDMSIEPTCVKKHEENPEKYPSTSEGLILGKDSTIANVFVHVISGPVMDKKYSPPDNPVVLSQDGCQYHPHVLALMAGQKLKILNEDGVLHNLHFMPKVNRPFNATMPPFLKVKYVSFKQPEPIFHIKCDVHPWMSGYIAVESNPFYDVTQKDGIYKISNLPPGKYKIEAWQENLGTQTAEITIKGNETKTVNFTFTYGK